MTTPAWRVTEERDRDEINELVERAVSGDRAAFGALYSRYRHMVERTALRHMGLTQPADVEDVVSEVFCKALENIHRFTPRGGGFPAWLATLAKGQALNTHRVKESPARESDIADSEVQDVTADVELVVLANERRERFVCVVLPRLVEALTDLPPRQKVAVRDRELKRRRIIDIATQFGISPNAAAALRYRGMTKLRQSAQDIAEAVS